MFVTDGKGTPFEIVDLASRIESTGLAPCAPHTFWTAVTCHRFPLLCEALFSATAA
jgi:hypothetical protein